MWQINHCIWKQIWNCPLGIALCNAECHLSNPGGGRKFSLGFLSRVIMITVYLWVNAWAALSSNLEPPKDSFTCGTQVLKEGTFVSENIIGDISVSGPYPKWLFLKFLDKSQACTWRTYFSNFFKCQSMALLIINLNWHNRTDISILVLIDEGLIK